MELLKSKDVKTWREAINSYPTRIISLNKPSLVSLDEFYRIELPSHLRSRLPTPYLTRSELYSLMQWKLTRGKYRPRLLDYVKGLDEELVKSASQKAFLSLPGDLSKAVSELTILKGVGPATASAVLAAYRPDVAPFMSDEARLIFFVILLCKINCFLLLLDSLLMWIGSSKPTSREYIL